MVRLPGSELSSHLRSHLTGVRLDTDLEMGAGA
jgi:hypothetical protein